MKLAFLLLFDILSSICQVDSSQYQQQQQQYEQMQQQQQFESMQQQSYEEHQRVSFAEETCKYWCMLLGC